MTSGDWIQAATLVAVAVALLLNVRQNREVARQTQELTLQNATIAASLQQSAHQAMISVPSANRAALLRDNPELLAWHMTLRGYPPGTYHQNLRRLFILSKLDVHELTFISYSDGLLAEDIWLGWRNVIAEDFTDPDFVESWATAKHLYAPSFVGYVDAQVVGWEQPGAAVA
jgi:hypothetical protein